MSENIIPEKQGDLFSGVYEYKPNTCFVCGKPLPKSKSNNRKYCSTMCRRIAERTPERIKHITDRNNRMGTIKNLVYRAYGYKCAICGWQIADHLIKGKSGNLYSYGCEIHHIVPVAEGGHEEDDNLILLCPNCHKVANEGFYSPEKLKSMTRRLDDLGRPSICDDITQATFEMKDEEKMYYLTRPALLHGYVVAKNFDEAVVRISHMSEFDENFRKVMIAFTGDWEKKEEEVGLIMSGPYDQMKAKEAQQ